MYRKPPAQVSVYDYVSPFGRGLDPENRWVRLAEIIPWGDIEDAYAKKFRRGGAPAKPSRLAYGALLIQRRLNISDTETVAQITENPYLQFFIGLTEFQTAPPFNPSLMTRFRQRINPESIHEMNEQARTMFSNRI